MADLLTSSDYVAFALGAILLALIGCVIVFVYWLYSVKDYYAEVEDIYMKEMVEKIPDLSIEKQDLIRDIIEDD